MHSNSSLLTVSNSQEKLRPISEYCNAALHVTWTLQSNHLKIPRHYSSKQETKLHLPFDRLSWLICLAARCTCWFLFEIPSTLDNQKHSPHLPLPDSTSSAVLAWGLSAVLDVHYTGSSNIKKLQNPGACAISVITRVFSQYTGL